jgi:prepilin-type N-terminal cleavage/methylation domain-containing protein
MAPPQGGAILLRAEAIDEHPAAIQRQRTSIACGGSTTTMTVRQTGFSLLEIAVVLVILGLVLGGVLKGQELISGARVRYLIRQQNDLRIAYFAFFDRYHALPGDYAGAVGVIPDLSTAACNGGKGNGNSRIETTGNENILVWEHLSKAGFLNTKYTCEASVSPTTTPINPYGDALEIVFDANYAGTAITARHSLKTGAHIPSNILHEIDWKTDDGNPLQGIFRAVPPATDCYDVASSAWLFQTPGSNCAGATLF